MGFMSFLEAGLISSNCACGSGSVALQVNWCQRVRHFPRVPGPHALRSDGMEARSAREASGGAV